MDFQYVKDLYDQQLWSNLCLVGSLIDPEMTSAQKLPLFSMLGEAHFQLGEVRKAEHFFKEALNLKRTGGKSNGNLGAEFGEESLKFKLHSCYLKLQMPQRASQTLQSIPTKQRSARSNMALGRLYQKAGMERAAVTCYKVCSCTLIDLRRAYFIECVSRKCSSPVPWRWTPHKSSFKWALSRKISTN